MKENLSKFYGDPDWVLVEEILKECLAKVSYTPESTTAPTDFKAQTLANKRLYDAVMEFLTGAKVVGAASPNRNPFE
jgi:hypothetical protein